MQDPLDIDAYHISNVSEFNVMKRTSVNQQIAPNISSDLNPECRHKIKGEAAKAWIVGQT